ncbi:hypothetical protein SRHO_G00134080 [Serrasalmus rhombeus]
MKEMERGSRLRRMGKVKSRVKMEHGKAESLNSAIRGRNRGLNECSDEDVVCSRLTQSFSMKRWVYYITGEISVLKYISNSEERPSAPTANCSQGNRIHR